MHCHQPFRRDRIAACVPSRSAVAVVPDGGTVPSCATAAVFRLETPPRLLPHLLANVSGSGRLSSVVVRMQFGGRHVVCGELRKSPARSVWVEERRKASVEGTCSSKQGVAVQNYCRAARVLLVALESRLIEEYLGTKAKMRSR